MLVNHREPGANFKTKMVSTDILATEMKPGYLDFTPQPLPCFNFHLAKALKERAKAFCPFTPYQLAWSPPPK